MKKIGILTFHYPNNMNFGASLQSYAVVKMLSKYSSKVYLIDYNPKKIGVKGNILFTLCGKNFLEYSRKFLKKTTTCKDLNDLEELNKKVDYFVVGSDQVWRELYTKPFTKNYYFDFVDDNKTKIAYAASFGVDYWEGDENLTKEIKKLAQRFDHVSVREESGIKICKNHFDIEAVCVLDPTMMISKEDYQPILDDYKDKSHKKNKYIAHMLLDDSEELKLYSNKIADYLNSEVNYIKGKTRKILGKKIFFYNKVSQWLTYLKDSELVVTDSFHCTVFSILFNKKFVVVANPERGTARLENLLSIVGLEDRFFTDIKKVTESGILEKEIDYKEVEKKLDVHREYSRAFLKKALGDV